MKPTLAIPSPILYRGFSVSASGPQQEIIVKHARTRGCWVTGYYAYTQADDKHWIISLENHTQEEVLPQTVGFLEPTSGHFSGDVCYYQDEIQGILRFDRHKNGDSLNREEVSFYIDWQGTSMAAMVLSQNLLYWAKNKDITWSGTMWDSKSKKSVSQKSQAR